jgi:hypothetical protein
MQRAFALCCSNSMEERAMRAFAILTLLLATAGCATTGPPASVSSLRAVDELQRRLIEARDAAGMADLAHPDLRINAPTGQVLRREQLIAMMASGEVAAEAFQRVPEEVRISGNIGVVMGHELFTATADSSSGRMFGTGPLRRRYTNIYVWEGGRWRFLARHANVVPGAR